MLAETGMMTQSFTLQVRQRGQLTLPQKVREAMFIEEGDTFTLVQIGDVLLLSRKTLRGPELGDKFMALMEEKGITLAELLAELPKIRAELSVHQHKAEPT